MTNQFKMTNRELVSYFLGIEVAQTSEGIIISKKGKKKKELKGLGYFEMVRGIFLQADSYLHLKNKVQLTKQHSDELVDSCYFNGIVELESKDI